MSINLPANERQQLYERFKKSLSERNDSEFFDADDLVIIIDQAVDFEDEYVQIEALMRGYRFFPDNEQLANRRAFLYYNLNLDAGVHNMIEHKPDDSPMWDLLKLRTQEGDLQNIEDAQSILESLLQRPEKFDDETVIQFVDCASACGLFDWLKANEKLLRRKADYLPTLLYELFIVSDLNSDYEYSIKLLEELTEIEPFNGDFWGALAQTQCNAELLDAALSSIEYALAIDSENVGVLTLKASILIRLEQYHSALKIIESLIDKNRTSLLGELKARALYGLGEIEQTHSVISEFNALFPEDRTLVEIALYLQHPNISQILELHYDAINTDEQKKWEEWAHSQVAVGQVLGASQILQCLRSRNELSYAGYKVLATTLYSSKSFTAAIDLLNSALEHENDALTPDVIIAGLVSHVHLGQKNEAKRAFEKIMTRLPLSIYNNWTMSSTLQSIGFSSFLGHFNTLLETPGPIDPGEVDIFHFPSFEDTDND